MVRGARPVSLVSASSRALRCGPCVTVVRHPLSHVGRTPCASGALRRELVAGAALVWMPWPAMTLVGRTSRSRLIPHMSCAGKQRLPAWDCPSA